MLQLGNIPIENLTGHVTLDDILTLADGNALYLPVGTPVASTWGSISGTLSSQTDLQAALDSLTAAIATKANSTHTHAQSDITGLIAALAAKEPTITATTSADYYRGDKTFATLNKAAVGLPNVDNTSDANKPVSTAQAAADALKANLAGGNSFTGNQSITGNLTVTAGIYGGAFSGLSSIWSFSAAYPEYGVAYSEGTPDSIRLDVSGQLLSGTPDVEITPDTLKVNGSTAWHAGNLGQFGTSVAGYVPLSGGGSTNFLRADGTWTAPPSLTDGDKGDVVVSSSGTVLKVESASPTGEIFSVPSQINLTKPAGKYGILVDQGNNTNWPWLRVTNLGQGDAGVSIAVASGFQCWTYQSGKMSAGGITNGGLTWYADNNAYDASGNVFQFACTQRAADALIELQRIETTPTGDFIRAKLSGGTFPFRVTAAGNVMVPEEAYASGWNASLEVPTKNAVYDKIEALDAAKQGLDATLTALAALAWSAGTQVPIFTAADTVSFKTVGSASGNLLDKAAGDALYQPLDTQLTDIAALSYSGNAGKVIKVNAGGTAFELAVDAGGGGATLSDGDYGDITVSAGGTVVTVESAAGNLVVAGEMSADAVVGNTISATGLSDLQMTSVSELIVWDGFSGGNLNLTQGLIRSSTTGNVDAPLTIDATVATFTGAIVVADDAYHATNWNGSANVPTKNAVRDVIEGLSGVYQAAGSYQPLDAYLTDIADLTDPGADRLMFWDDSAGELTWLTLGTNLSITGTTLDAAGGGVSDGDKGDITVSGTGATWTIDNAAVTLANMADVSTGTVFYRKTASTGAPETQTLATLKTDLGLTGTNSGDQTITLTGNVTGSGTGSFATTIAANAVTLANMAQVATATFLGRTTASTGNVEALTATQATALLNLATASVKGLAPAFPNNTTTFLRGDGTYAAAVGTTTAALTFNNGGSGDASGTTFSGGTARTLSYNSIGAAPTASPTFTGTVTAATVTASGVVTGTNIVQGFNFGCSGKPAHGEIWAAGIAPYAYTIVQASCVAIATVAATASTVFTIKRNTTTVGTVTFAAAGTTGTFSITSGAVTAGQHLTVECPATADATLANISMLIRT